MMTSYPETHSRTASDLCCVLDVLSTTVGIACVQLERFFCWLFEDGHASGTAQVAVNADNTENAKVGSGDKQFTAKIFALLPSPDILARCKIAASNFVEDGEFTLERDGGCSEYWRVYWQATASCYGLHSLSFGEQERYRLSTKTWFSSLKIQEQEAYAREMAIAATVLEARSAAHRREMVTDDSLKLDYIASTETGPFAVPFSSRHQEPTEQQLPVVGPQQIMTTTEVDSSPSRAFDLTNSSDQPRFTVVSEVPTEKPKMSLSSTVERTNVNASSYADSLHDSETQLMFQKQETTQDSGWIAFGEQPDSFSKSVPSSCNDRIDTERKSNSSLNESESNLQQDRYVLREFPAFTKKKSDQSKAQQRFPLEECYYDHRPPLSSYSYEEVTHFSETC